MKNFLFSVLFLSFFISCSEDDSVQSSNQRKDNFFNKKEKFEKLGNLLHTNKNSIGSRSLSEISAEELEKEALEFYNIYNEIKLNYLNSGGDETLFNDYFVQNLVSEIASKAYYGVGVGCWSTYLAGLTNCSGNYLADLAGCPGSPFLNPVCVTGTYAQYVQCTYIEYNNFQKCIKK